MEWEGTIDELTQRVERIEGAVFTSGFLPRLHIASANAGTLLVGDKVTVGSADLRSYALAVNGSLEVAFGDIYFTPVVAPGALTIASVSSGGSVDVGNHYYKVTFVTSSGETELGTVSAVATTTSTNKTVNLTSIPVCTQTRMVTSRKIYRTKAGGSSYYLLTTITGSATTTYTDTTADASLGADDATNRLNNTTAKLYVGASPTGYVWIRDGGVRIGETASTKGPSLVLKNDSTSDAWIWLNGSGVSSWGGANALHITNFYDAPITFWTNVNQERMRITGGGQVAIGTDSPATSALLDLSSTTGALLLPRMTTTQRNALTAVNGMVIYNTTTGSVQAYKSDAWGAL